MTRVDERTPPSEASDLPAIVRPWHTVEVAEVQSVLGVDAQGLGADEVTRRLAHYGPNQVEGERVTPWWQILLHQFRDPLIYILLAATAVTLLLRDFVDAGVIAAVVLINAIIGFTQEIRARNAIQGLARMSAPKAEVIRGGRPCVVESRDVVPGDLVVLASGARVPADVRLVRITDLEVDESALTGESLPVRKDTAALYDEALVPGDQYNLAFAGTVVTRGRARGFVVRTGAETELGRIATAVREVGVTQTPLQETTDRLGRWIGYAVLFVSLLTLVIGLIRGLVPAEIFLTVVALAVATVPEGLPVVLTVTLAVGVRRMARRNAIIRSLPAVETLGRTTVIGSDKTGTLTRNEMTVRAIWAGGRSYEVTGAGYRPEGQVLYRGEPVAAADDRALRHTLIAGVLANEADAGALDEEHPAGDPTELALLAPAPKAGILPKTLRGEWSELDLLPFEPERRFMASLTRGPDGGATLYLKGAPEVILDRCDRMARPEGEGALDRETVHRAAADMAAEGLRVLAMAFKPTTQGTVDAAGVDGGFVFAGLQGMEDPVRPEAVAAVAAAREAGIRVLMLTGDHVDTARAIGRKLGLGGERALAIEGQQIATSSDEDLEPILDEVDVYARVAPEHKLRIVQRLKARGETVAVTGDGVNDAPALRAAHLGIAMGRSGTDVAREASDMVLADDNFATITAAIEEGRVVFSNVRKVTFFLLSTGVAMPLSILVALVAGMPLLMLPAQILWINLVTNGLQDVALAVEPGEPGLLKRPPRARGEGIVSLRVLERLFGVGLVIAAGTVGVFWWALESTANLEYARTLALTQMVVFQFFHVFNSRSLDRSIFQIPLFSNRFLFLSIVMAGLAQLAILYVPFMQRIFRTTPLDTGDWMLVLAVGSAVIVGGELDKWRNKRAGTPLG